MMVNERLESWEGQIIALFVCDRVEILLCYISCLTGFRIFPVSLELVVLSYVLCRFHIHVINVFYNLYLETPSNISGHRNLFAVYLLSF